MRGAVALVLLLGSPYGWADSPTTDPVRAGGVRLVDTAVDLLRTAEDPALPVRVRCEAARELGRLKQRGAVPRLASLLRQTEGCLLTFRIACALAEIGDARALPALRYMADRRDIDLPGKVNTAIQGAIEACK